MHIPIPPQTVMATLPESRPQAERVKRPMLTSVGQPLEQEEFEHFKYQFNLFKSRLSADQDGATLLRECLASDISRSVFSSHGTAMSSLSEKDLLEAISTCCVTKQTLQARNAVL